MIEDGSNIPDGTTISADVCIVGSGAAGITLARELMGSGLQVVVLEGSARDDRQPLAADHLEVLQRTETHPDTANAAYGLCEGHRFCDPLAQTLYEGSISPEMQQIDPAFLTRSRIRVYGGTTNCWGGWTRTLDAADFDRSDLDPLMVWPVSREALEPYYRVALRYCSLPAFAPVRYDDPDWWKAGASQAIQTLPRPTGKLRTAVWTVMNGRGPGNPDGALDFQVMWGPALAKDPNTLLIRNANTRWLETRGGAVAAAHATVIDYDTGTPAQSFTVRAERFVVAAGGIETPRLLLLSGLSDPYGTLGRYFMIHPLNTSAFSFTARRAADPAVRNFYSSYSTRYGPGTYPPTIFAALVPSAGTLQLNGMLNIRAVVEFSPYGGGRVNLNWEQAPSPENRVRLSDDPAQVDLFGDPRVALDWRHGALDQRTVEVGADLVAQELAALGLLDAVDDYDLQVRQPGDHHMGATRMSDAPENGYVDRDCRVHHLQNLFVASSSVFPTGGYANPTLTIIALAARLAGHLRYGAGAQAAAEEAAAEEGAATGV